MYCTVYPTVGYEDEVKAKLAAMELKPEPYPLANSDSFLVECTYSQREEIRIMSHVVAVAWRDNK